MPATTKTLTAFLLSSKVERFDRPVLEFTVEPCYFNEGGMARFYSGSGSVMDEAEDLAFGDLQIGASHDPVLTPEQTYGWHVEYRNAYAVNLRRADAMVKTLRKTDRGLGKPKPTSGAPETSAAYVTRIGPFPGVNHSGHRQSEKAVAMTGETYRWGDPNTLLWQ